MSPERRHAPDDAFALRGYAWVGAAAATWGTWSLFLRNAEREGAIAPALEAAIMLGVVFVATLPASLRRRPESAARPPRPRAAWLGLALLGAGDALNSLTFFAAMQKTTLAIAVLSHYLAPAFVALAAPLVIGERARAATFGAVALSLAGLVLVLEPWRGAPIAGWTGAALGAASAVFYAATMIGNKRLERHFTSIELLSWHCLPALVVLVVAMPRGVAVPAPRAVGLVSLGALVIGAGAGSAFLRGLRRVPASRAAVLTLLEPLVAVAVGVGFFGERLGSLAALGAVLVLLGASSVVGAR